MMQESVSVEGVLNRPTNFTVRSTWKVVTLNRDVKHSVKYSIVLRISCVIAYQ